MPKWVQDELPFDPPLPKNLSGGTRKSEEISRVLERRLAWIENEIGAIRAKLNAVRK